MARSNAEYALGRVLAWLRWSGVPVTRDMTRMALNIVEQALADGDADLFHRVFEALPKRIDVPEIRLPRAALPINRISLGYAPYL
ncbi:MAG: hypothetical protein WBO37_12000 [Gammaproteobacteria bacterium]